MTSTLLFRTHILAAGAFFVGVSLAAGAMGTALAAGVVFAGFVVALRQDGAW